MPINWIAAAKLIPWSGLAQATPKLMRSAKDLWASSRAAGNETPLSARVDAAAEMSPEQLRQRLTALENRQLETSALIASLAQQNAQLLEALLSLRLRMRGLALVCALLALAAAALWLG